MHEPAAPDHAPLVLDRLDAYRVALELVTLASKTRPRSAALRDQLDRASSSVALNLAEGVGRASQTDQARFFAVARGSAMECVAIWDVLRAQGAISLATHEEGRRLLTRVVAMLTRLMRARR